MENKDFGELARKCHENAVKHGFCEDKPSNEHCLMLVITEVAEMVNADRKGKYAPKEDMMKDGFDKDIFEKLYKDTMEDEMADIAIRLLSLAGKHGYPLLVYSRAKLIKSWFTLRTIPENAFELCVYLCRFYLSPKFDIIASLAYLYVWAESLGIDLKRHIAMNMKYNESRPFRHGKAY